MPRRRDPAVEQYLEHSGINAITKRRTKNQSDAVTQYDINPTKNRETRDFPKTTAEKMADDASWGIMYAGPEGRDRAFDIMRQRAREMDTWKTGGHHSAPNGEFMDKRIKKFGVKRTGQ